MKIREILVESAITDADLANVELLLGLNGDVTDSYTAIEQSLTTLQSLLAQYPNRKSQLRNAALIVNNIASNYLQNPLWKNVEKDPAAIELNTKITKVQQTALAIYNQLLS